MIFSCKKIALQKSKKLHHPPSFSCIIWPRNHSDTGCEQLHEGLQEGGRPIDNSKTENSSSKEQLGVKHDPGHGAAAGWELSSLFLKWEILDLLH